MSDVKTGNFGGNPFREMDEMRESIERAIMEFEGRDSLMAVVSVLRLIERRLLTEAHNGVA